MPQRRRRDRRRQTSAIWRIQYGQLINLASVPFIAVAYHLPFLDSRYNYSETLSFTLYATGHVFLWRAGLAVASVAGALLGASIFGGALNFALSIVSPPA